MNSDVEDLLREGMDRFTRDLRAPAGLTRRVTRRRRRRLALRSAAGVAAALTASAVALVAVGVPGGIGGPAVAAAAVLKRVDSALSAAEPGEIAQMTVTTSTVTPGGTTLTTTAEEWSYGDQWRSVTNSPSGQPVYDEGFSASSVYTLVSYRTRTWARQPGLGRAFAPAYGSRSCEPDAAKGQGLAPGGPVVPEEWPVPVPLLFRLGLPSIGSFISSLPATVARALRTAVSCGTLAVAGRQRVDGIEAIELTSRRNSPISETIWVSPGTYLPVRVVVRSAWFEPVRQTADVTWLPPTAQNLAKLTVPIPAGFRRVSLFEAITPNLLLIPGWPLAEGPGWPPSMPEAPCYTSPAGPACKNGTSGFLPVPAPLSSSPG
jgi:hypothetical protein